MDPAAFLDDLTHGHVFGWKTAVASLVLALAALQVALAARFWGVGGLRVSPDAAARTHRWSGRLLVGLSLVVGYACLLGPAGPVSPLRVLVHSILGATLFALLAAKLLTLRSRGTSSDGSPSPARRLPALGLGLLAVYVALWATSVADFVLDSTADPGPSAVLKVWAGALALVAAVLGVVGVGGFVASAGRRSAGAPGPAPP